MRIGITGSEGLIGSAVKALCKTRQDEVVCFDWCDNPTADILNIAALNSILRGVDGILHLAAVSRVIWGERNPTLCYQTNVVGTYSVLYSAMLQEKWPWVLLASSREVYGEPEIYPVREDVKLQPINTYGRSKRAAEAIALSVRDCGLRTGVVRLSNVYGSTDDHPDRVVPAFCRAAATGADLRVDGGSHTFDFTHVSDAARGIYAMMQALDAGEVLPPIHLLPGRGTTLRQLAGLAIATGGGRSKMVEAPPRGYDVCHFIGDPQRAAALLDWRASVSIEDGVAQLTAQFRAEAV